MWTGPTFCVDRTSRNSGTRRACGKASEMQDRGEPVAPKRPKCRIEASLRRQSVRNAGSTRACGADASRVEERDEPARLRRQKSVQGAGSRRACGATQKPLAQSLTSYIRRFDIRKRPRRDNNAGSVYAAYVGSSLGDFACPLFFLPARRRRRRRASSDRTYPSRSRACSRPAGRGARTRLLHSASLPCTGSTRSCAPAPPRGVVPIAFAGRGTDSTKGRHCVDVAMRLPVRSASARRVGSRAIPVSEWSQPVGGGAGTLMLQLGGLPSTRWCWQQTGGSIGRESGARTHDEHVACCSALRYCFFSAGAVEPETHAGARAELSRRRAGRPTQAAPDPPHRRRTPRRRLCLSLRAD